MKFPCLVSKRFCNTQVNVVIESTDLSEDGELEDAVTIETKCNL